MTTPLKVLYFIDNLDSGGTQRQLTLLLNNLDPAVVRPTLCTYQPERDFFLPQIDSSRVRIVSIPKTRRLQPGFLVSLTRYIRRERFDVVHSFLRSSNVWGCLAGRLAGVKLVVATERRAVFGATFTDSVASNIVLRLAHLVATNSRFARDRLQQATLISRDRISVIYNGLPGMAPTGPPPREGLTLSMVATLAHNKNHRCVVDAFDAAFSQLPKPAVLQFVGNEGDGSIRRELEDRLSGRPCEKAVRFLGLRNDIDRVFSDSHGVVLASFNEAFPNVLIEAMLCERPVLASDTCEHPWIVGSGSERGWLFAPSDPRQLANAMIELGGIDRPELLEIGRRCRQWALDNFSVSQMVQETVGLYDRLSATS